MRRVEQRTGVSNLGEWRLTRGMVSIASQGPLTLVVIKLKQKQSAWWYILHLSSAAQGHREGQRVTAG